MKGLRPTVMGWEVEAGKGREGCICSLEHHRSRGTQCEGTSPGHEGGDMLALGNGLFSPPRSTH